jgi:hypothetical protein
VWVQPLEPHELTGDALRQGAHCRVFDISAQGQKECTSLNAV